MGCRFCMLMSKKAKKNDIGCYVRECLVILLCKKMSINLWTTTSQSNRKARLQISDSQ